MVVLKYEQNERICRVGPGTDMGNLLRRYWHPVGESAEITTGGKPKAVKVLGEELVLFRDDRGRPGLLARRCAHRLTSLAYGRPEDGGIRCPFHGWLFDIEGNCLQQPAEPRPFCDKIKHPAYPCRDLGGLIFAYMGPPEKMPLLPNYEVLVRDGGTRAMDVYPAGGNFLQHVEGAIDTTHLSYLHATNWSRTKDKLFAMPKPELTYTETDYGLWQKSIIPNVTAHSRLGNTEGIMQTLYTYFILPGGFLRVQEHIPNSGLIQKVQSWYVPADDTTTIRYQVGFSPPWPDGRPYEWSDLRTEQPSAQNDYFRDYEHTDTISGIPVDVHRTPIAAEISFIPQDMMANEEQGPIVDRTLENLGAHDKVVVAMRRMYFEAMDVVASGKDPKHVIRDPSQNAIVYVRGQEEGELV